MKSLADKLTEALEYEAEGGFDFRRVHPDDVEGIYNLPGFVPVTQYGPGTVPRMREIGACRNVRYLRS